MTKPFGFRNERRKHWDMTDDQGMPVAFVLDGHVSMERFLKQANDAFLGERPYNEENSFYQYAVIEGSDVARLNVAPQTAGAIAVTVGYWEEPYPEQEKYERGYAKTLRE